MEIADLRLKQMFLTHYSLSEKVSQMSKIQIYFPKQEMEIGGNGGKDTVKEKRINHYFVFDFSFLLK